MAASFLHAAGKRPLKKGSAQKADDINNNFSPVQLFPALKSCCCLPLNNH
jgi:hypothetical protein